MNKAVYVVIELHPDCPKIRGVFSTITKANEVAYAKNNPYWSNVFRMELDKAN